jgi:tetratricopeptide (TPR) repeat protein
MLDALRAQPASRRAAAVAAAGLPDRVVDGLVEAARRLVLRDLAAALDATGWLVTLADERCSPFVRCRARRARAQALAYANRYDEALSLLAEAIDLAGAAGAAVEAARARMAMVHALTRQGRLDEAIAEGAAARRVFEAYGERALAAKADANLGEAHRMRNEPAAALICFDRALGSLADDPLAFAQIESNRAQALVDLNRFAEGEAAYRKALAALDGPAAARAGAIVEGNLADLLVRQGRVEAALRHFERARRALEDDAAAGDRARLLAEQGEAYALAGFADEAIEAFRTARPDLLRCGLIPEAARAAVALGRALVRRGALDEAEAALAEAERAFSGLGHDTGLGRATLGRGELAAARGCAGEAAAYFDRARVLLRERPAEAAAAAHALGSCALEAGRLDEAAGVLDAAIEDARQHGVAPLLADLLHARARLRCRCGDAHGALGDLRDAVAETDRIRGSFQAERLRSAFAADRGAVYADLVGALLDGPAPAVGEAFAAAERARARALLDLVGGAVDFGAGTAPEATDPGAAPLVRAVTRLRADLDALYSRLSDLSTAGSAASAAWRGEVDRRQRELEAVEQRLVMTRGPGGVFAPPVELPALQALLAPGTTLIEYFHAGDELLAFVVDRRRATVVRGLASAEDVADMVDAVRFQVGRAIAAGPAARDRADLAADARRELAALDALVLRPLRDRIDGAQRLIVVPHGPLHVAPFGALHDGERYLLELCEVAMAPSASLLRHLDEDAAAAPPEPDAALVMGVGDPAAPGMRAEALDVGRALGAQRVLIDGDATSDRLRIEGRTARLVHLACHGRFEPRRPLFSGLRLADRYVTVRELYEMSFPGAVVVLSGCDTGRAAIGGGDELTGLMRGLFAAGATRLVLALWTVDDESARCLMAAAYRLWQNGSGSLSLPGALRASSLDALARWPHPAHWAPFIMVGGR